MIDKYDRVEATFAPQRSDDLKPGVEDWVGRRLLWMASWIIDDVGSPYEGQWAMTAEGADRPPFAWVPLCDLSDITPIE